MRLFRRVPTPFAITYLVSGLLRESFQKRKADKYAAQVVHHYKPGESPYPSRTVGTLEEELERLDDTLKKYEEQKKWTIIKKPAGYSGGQFCSIFFFCSISSAMQLRTYSSSRLEIVLPLASAYALNAACSSDLILQETTRIFSLSHFAFPRL